MHKGGFSPLFYKGMPEEAKNIFRAGLTARFTYLDQHFSGCEYLMGLDYSIADAHLFVVSNWASWVNFDLSPYANVISYRQRIAERAAVRLALDEEDLIPWPSSVP